MIAMRDVGNVANLLENSPLSTSKLWWRDIEAISSIEIVAFIERMKIQGYGREAQHNVYLMQNEVEKAVVRGQIKNVPLLKLKPPSKPATTGEILNLIGNFSLVRRKAVFTALEQNMNLNDVIELRWKHLASLDLTPYAQQIKMTLPRHITCDFVFWEYSKRAIALPLFGLEKQFEETSCRLSWDEFCALYHGAVRYDYHAESVAFQRQLVDYFT